MQIKGEDFLKKVQLQKEKEELERKLTELDESRTNFNNGSPNNLNNYYDNLSSNQNGRYSDNQQYENEEFDSIMLNNPEFENRNFNNKRKYLILAILLIVLFLITIIIFRVSSPDSQKEDQFKSNNNLLTDDTATINNALDDNYQRIVNTNKSNQDTSNTSIDENLDSINLTDSSSSNDSSSSISEETLTQTIQKIKNEKINPKQNAPQQVEQRKSVANLVGGKEKNSASVRNFSSGTNGFFVQIGAFSKMPSEDYFNEIKKLGLKYKILKAEVNGKMFNKVIIGPYASYEVASSNIQAIKEMLKLQSAFIVKD